VRIAGCDALGCCCRGALVLSASALGLGRAVVVEGAALARAVWKHRPAGPVLRRRTKLVLGALDAMMDGLLPVVTPLRLVGGRRSGRSLGAVHLEAPPGAYGVDRGPRRCRHPNTIRVVLEAALDPVAWRQKSVESLDQVGMSGKEIRYPADDTGSVDPSRSSVRKRLQSDTRT